MNQLLPSILLLGTFLPGIGHVADVEVVDGRYEGERYVSIEGTIEPGDLRRVETASREAIRLGTNTLTYLLNSEGGDVEEAIKIGELARKLMAKTYVYGMVFYTPGTPAGNELEEFGRQYSQQRFHLAPVAPGAEIPSDKVVRCYSACVLIFYGGVSRVVSDNLDYRAGYEPKRSIPIIGLHRPYFSKESFARLSPTESQIAYAALEAAVRKYLIRMGAPESVIERMRRSSSVEMDLVHDDEFNTMYRDTEPFMEEWMIAKCGAFGPEASLTDSEIKAFTAHQSALKAAIQEGSIASAAEYENFSIPQVPAETIVTLEEKIHVHNGRVMTCRDSALYRFQRQWKDKSITNLQ